MSETTQDSYECQICGDEQSVYRDYDKESAVGICNLCWYGFLTGAERKHTAKRVDEQYA